MDSLITAAARALKIGDPLGALKRIALRNDPPALALRGTAMAQLGDLARARALLREAGRAYGPREALSRARCVIAEAEIALASRDLHWSSKAFNAALTTLDAHGDRVNAAHARHLETRRLLLIGRLDEAEHQLRELDADALTPALLANHELVVAGIAVRRVQAASARSAFARASRAAWQSGIPALAAEVEAASRVLTTPAARLIARGNERELKLGEVEALLSSTALIVDACRFSVREAGVAIELARRPVLFTLVRTLAEAWPVEAKRATLLARAFRARRADDTYRARLRVEIGRLRKLLEPLADVAATERGFAILPHRANEIVVLARPVDDEHAAVLALLADGEAWSSSALALALGAGPRSVQRALESLAKSGKVRSVGRGRACRWLTEPLPGFTTTLLLPSILATA